MAPSKWRRVSAIRNPDFSKMSTSHSHLSESIPRRGLVHFRLGYIAALFLVGSQLPFFGQFLVNLSKYRPHYEFVPVIFLTVGWLAWTRWPTNDEASRLSTLVSFAMFLAAATAAAVAVFLFSPWVGAIAFVFLIGGMGLHFGGKGALKLWAIWCLLWLMIPPPMRYDQALIDAMQAITTQASSKILDFIGVLHFRAGNVIEIADRELFVAEACSGVKSQLVLVAMTAILMVVWRRPVRHSLVLIALALGWATLVNILRVTSVVVALDWFDLDLSHGWQHEVLGLVLVFFGLLLVMSTDQLLGTLAAPVRRPKRRRNRLVRMWNRWLAYEIFSASSRDSVDDEILPDVEEIDEDNEVERTSSFARSREILTSLLTWSNWATRKSSPAALVVGTFFLLVGALQIAELSQSRAVQVNLDTAALVFDAKALPVEMAGWERLDYETERRDRSSEEGECSQIWTYRADGMLAHVSVDYPFVGWHELTNCYEGRGWRIESRRVRRTDDGGNLVEVEMSSPSGESGYLLFSLFDGLGNPVSPRTTHWKGFAARIDTSPLVQLLRANGPIPPETVGLQVQQFLASPTPYSETERDELLRRYLDIRRQLRERWLDREGNS